MERANFRLLEAIHDVIVVVFIKIEYSTCVSFQLEILQIRSPQYSLGADERFTQECVVSWKERVEFVRSCLGVTDLYLYTRKLPPERDPLLSAADAIMIAAGRPQYNGHYRVLVKRGWSSRSHTYRV